ncbi:NUDIX hydrolase [Nocardioides sp. InS609-2]|uniref:NUDIX hydrolase n=1 Tax=Nocardioides sp. InS609-2 TaxID=2760705 RepID=UPI0020BDFDC8|nr:NUDIX hydrolase [Nocardioides sp. InS609-2]
MPYDVVAAGAVVTRRGGEVLLVHRPRYDDWSFPKGKRDRGEHILATAVREVAEETGLHVRLGPRLDSQRYPSGKRMKTVHYWMGRAVGPDDIGSYLVNDEIDELMWLPWEEASARLTYPHDRDTLAQARPLRRNSRALVVLRHGLARSRDAWRRDDRLRPLLRTGTMQAERLVPLLAAYDLSVIASSSSQRCVKTVAPYSETTGWPLATHDALTEEDATAQGVLELVDQLVYAKEGALVCTHRPVLPTVYDALGVDEAKLEPAAMLVVHHRKGKVVATEQHTLL